MDSKQARGERDGNSQSDGPVARLYLSGGGLRAMFGSIGVILYLMVTGQWAGVTEVVSVSGGSTTNAALLTAGGWTNDDLTDVERLRAFYLRLLEDRAHPLRTTRRIMITALLALLILLCLGLVVAAAVGVRPLGLPNSVFATGLGLAMFPVALQLGRRLATAYLRDVIESVSDSGGVALATLAARPRVARGSRQHIFCASGLTSRAPYFFWAGPKGAIADHQRDGTLAWGYPIRPTSEQNDYTLGDAVLASSSLPTVGSVRSPRRADTGDGARFDVMSSELLVDGGANGIFGDQLRMPFMTNADRVSPAWNSVAARTIMVDAFRHPKVPDRKTIGSRLARFTLRRLSTMMHLVGWIKLASESLYVNDLLDAATAPHATLLRLSEPGERFVLDSSDRLDAGTEQRISALKASVASLELFNLNAERAVSALTTGFVEAWLRIEGTTAGLDEALAEAGELLFGPKAPGRPAFAERWTATTTPATHPPAKTLETT